MPGCRTFLSRHMVTHPGAMVPEAFRLQNNGVRYTWERMMVDERALVITPFHQSMNRLREIARGANRHGSCWVGVGETVADSLAGGDDVIRFGDLRDVARPMASTLSRPGARPRPRTPAPSWPDMMATFR